MNPKKKLKQVVWANLSQHGKLMILDRKVGLSL